MTRADPYNVLTNRDDFNFLKDLIWYTNTDSLINNLDKRKTRMKLNFPVIVYIWEVFPKHCVYDITAL